MWRPDWGRCRKAPPAFFWGHPMSGFTVKVYVVQQADRNGNLIGPVLAAKLTLKDAHAVAKEVRAGQGELHHRRQDAAAERAGPQLA